LNSSSIDADFAWLIDFCCWFSCVQSEFVVSSALTALFYVPGIVYSVWVVILKTPPEPPGIDGERPYYILA
jgi:hypothetical protein